MALDCIGSSKSNPNPKGPCTRCATGRWWRSLWSSSHQHCSSCFQTAEKHANTLPCSLFQCFPMVGVSSVRIFLKALRDSQRCNSANCPGIGIGSTRWPGHQRRE